MSEKPQTDNTEHKISYAHENAISFDLGARCSKIFGLWIADVIGLKGADAQNYAREVVATNLDEPGFDDVLFKVQDDLAQKGIEIPGETLKEELDNALAEARKQSHKNP